MAIQDTLWYLARRGEEGGSARRKDLRSSEEFWRVSAHRKAEDPFKAVAWSLNAIRGWHLAAITMSRFLSGQVGPLSNSCEFLSVWDCILLLISRAEDPAQDLSIAKANRHKSIWEAVALSEYQARENGTWTQRLPSPRAGGG